MQRIPSAWIIRPARGCIPRMIKIVFLVSLCNQGVLVVSEVCAREAVLEGFENAARRTKKRL
jgi:hypothetical protein